MTGGSGPAWSPGREIVFVSNRDGDSEIFVMNEDGSGPRLLTQKGGHNSAPAWSPDGKQIAFVSERDGNAEIYLMNADGSGERNLTRSRNRHERWLSWAPAQKP